MKVKVKKAPKRKRFHHASIRLPKMFVWKLLQKVYEDTLPDALEVGLKDDADLFRGLIRRRDVAGYITACSSRWSLTQLNCMVENDGETLRKIRILRLYTIGEKYIFPDSPFDPESAAREKFFAFEQKCQLTNSDPIFWQCLSDDEDPEMSHYDSLFIWPIVQRAREFIGKVLGESYCETDLLLRSHHGPGASLGRHGRRSIPVGKYLPPYTITDDAVALFDKYLNSDERLQRALADSGIDLDVSVRSYSKILFVPKNAKTLRTILVEPTGNVFLQLGVFSFMRDRLKKFGIDITTQKKNQQLAHLYSVNDEGVTIDLQGASDLVAMIWLVLFPPEWAKLLYSLRSPAGTLPNSEEKIVFEKLSSMGNGYTFTVQTLIFSAITYGVIREMGGRWKDNIANLSIYGDDIVIPKRYYSCVAATLKRLGFKLNARKSFSSGHIRESCGTDYFFGHDISIFHLKHHISDHCDLLTIHNSLFSVENRFGISLEGARTYVLSQIPEESQSFGLPSEEVSAYIFTRDPSAIKRYFSKNYQRFFYKVGIVTKVRPPLEQPLSKVFGEEVIHFLPLTDWLSSLQPRGRTDEDRRLYERVGWKTYYKDLLTRERMVQIRPRTEGQFREEFLQALYDKRAYSLRSSVVSRCYETSEISE